MIGCRARRRSRRYARQHRLAVSAHAFRIGSVERHPGEELRRHAPALAGVVAAATGAGAGGGRLAQLAEQPAVSPDLGEPAGGADRTGAELFMDGERACVHVADGIDQADDPAGSAHVQPGQRRAEGVEMEEAVTGEDLVAVGVQPAIDRALLVLGRVELVPRVGAAARRAQPGDAQLGAVAVGERLEVVELGDVVPGDDDGDLERPEPGGSEVVHRRPRPGERAGATDGIVRRHVDTVEAHLHVEVGHRRQPLRRSPVDERAVGRELDADPLRRGVLDELEEVGAEHRLAAADVDVEDLQGAPARRARRSPRRSSARAGHAGPTTTGSGRRRGCRRRSAPRSGRSGRRARP